MRNMSVTNAKKLIKMQEKALSKADGFRFVYGNYEYRVSYQGGFAAFVSIDRRMIGKRNFKYFDGFGAYHMRNAQDIINKATEIVEMKGE